MDNWQWKTEILSIQSICCQLSIINYSLVCRFELLQEACVIFGEHTKVFHLVF